MRYFPPGFNAISTWSRKISNVFLSGKCSRKFDDWIDHHKWHARTYVELQMWVRMAFFMYVTSKIQLYSHYDHREISDKSSIPIYLGDKFQPCLLEQARRLRQQSNNSPFSREHNTRNNEITAYTENPWTLAESRDIADRSTALYSVLFWGSDPGSRI